MKPICRERFQDINASSVSMMHIIMRFVHTIFYNHNFDSLVPRPSASSAPCALRVIIKCGGGQNGGRRPGRIYHVIRALSDVTLLYV